MNGEVRWTDMNVIVSAVRASSSLLVDCYPDLTVGARLCRAFGALGVLKGNVPL